MDRIYVPQWNKAPVHQLGLDLWRDVVVRHDAVVQHTIPERLRFTMLGMVATERNGDKIDRPLMKAMTTMLVDLGAAVYEEDFEQPFLAATTEFYQV
jgi:cullin 3